jgi:tRNA A37 threonylcarbamoyltransferase TsaD
MTEAEQIKQLREALQTLVRMHQNWDKGTAYIPVKFMHDNNAAIAVAREALHNSESNEV